MIIRDSRKHVGRTLPAGAAPAHLVLRNTAINFGAQVVHVLCFAAVFFILARTLDKAALGTYYTVFAIMVPVERIMEGGISTVLTARIAQAAERWRRLFIEAAGVLMIVAAASAASLLLLGCVWAIVSGNARYVLYFSAAACACAAVQVRRFSAATFNAFDLFRQESLARVLHGVLFVAFVALLAISGTINVGTALASLGASELLAALYLAARLQQQWRCWGVHISRASVGDWLARATPLGAADGLRELILQLGTLVLGIMQPASAVGIYSMAYRPLNPLTVLPQAVLLAVFPSFSRLAVNDHKQLRKAFSNSIRMLWVVSIPIAIVIFVWADVVVRILGGPRYADAATPMRLLIWITTLYCISVQFRFLLAALGKQRTYVRLLAILLPLELMAMILLIPYWGYIGACISSLAGELFLAIAGFAACYRLGINGIAWGAMFRAAAAGAAAGAALWLLRGSSWPTMAIGTILSVGLYFALCLAMRAMDLCEIRTMYTALSTMVARWQRRANHPT